MQLSNSLYKKVHEQLILLQKHMPDYNGISFKYSKNDIELYLTNSLLDLWIAQAGNRNVNALWNVRMEVANETWQLIKKSHI